VYLFLSSLQFCAQIILDIGKGREGSNQAPSPLGFLEKEKQNGTKKEIYQMLIPKII
jgi:hypothetical protein